MRKLTLLVAALAVGLTACGGGDGSETTGSSETSCPLDALAAAAKPVEITYWHAMTRVNEDTLKKLTDEFNARQNDIRVRLSAAPTYPDNLTRFKAGLTTGELPDLFQGEDSTLQTMIDSGAITPAQSCLQSDPQVANDIVDRVRAYYTVQDTLYPMPFNNSNPILYYNKAAFARAGLDPDTPPVTLDEVRAASQQIVSRKATPYGIALKTDSWFIEHWLAKSAHTIVDNGNGRTARATKVTFDDATGEQLFTWINDMVRDELALSTGDSDLDHFLAVANEQAAITIDTSAGLGAVSDVLASGQYRDVKLGTGAMPGPNSPDGGVLVGGAANYVMRKSSPAEQAAAYTFAKYLLEPQVQATWAAATGYTPVSKTATTLKPLTTRWEQQPGYKIAYDQLLAGAQNDATAGPVLGPYGAKGQGLRGAIIDGLTAMLNENVAPADAVEQAATKANAAITEYNSRVG
jgi:sn-glycerol 3-phosphate transport system substrate-binding protein